MYLKRLSGITFLILFFFLVSCGNQDSLEQERSAIKGSIDLSNLNLETTEANLSGEWMFYHQELLLPSEISTKKEDNGIIYKLPKLWHKFQMPDSSYLPRQSYGTYHLHVKTDKVYRLLALRLGRIETAYAIWINDKFIYENGKVGKSHEEMIPKWKGTVVTFSPDSDEFDITLQVSNFYHKKGGIDTNIYLAEESLAQDSFFNTIWRDLVLFGVLIIMMAYHFGLFYLRRKDRTTLYFGFVSLFTGINILVSGQILLAHFFDNISWELVVTINHTTNFLRIVPLLMFLGESFKEEIPKKFVNGNIIWGAIWVVFILFTPAIIFTEVLPTFFVQVGVIVIFTTFWLFKALKRKRDGALQSLLGIGFIFIAALNDMAHDMGIIRTGYLVPYGVFAFVFFQAYMLSLRSANAYRSVEAFSSKMLTLNNIKNKFLEISGHDLSLSLNVLTESFNAKKGVTLLNEDNQWKVVAIVENGAQRNYDELLLKNVPDYELPHSIVDNVISEKKIVSFNFLNKNEPFQDNRYVQNNSVTSIICMPLIDQQEVRALIYLEQDSTNKGFNENQIEILDIMSSQVLTTIDNSLIYKELEIFNQTLEQQVEDRTQQIKQQNEEISAQRDEIETKSNVLAQAYSDIAQKNQDITDSINYSKRIQHSILPKDEYIKQLIPESFVLFRPKDVLSGDFYWVTDFTFRKNGESHKYIFAAAVDCTGHGVPGALMSIIGNNLLNYATKELHLTKPNEILDVMQVEIKERLNQQTMDSESKDGMDLSLIAYQPDTKKLCFSGARNPLISVTNGTHRLYKADSMSIGGSVHARKSGKKFTSQVIDIQEETSVYLFTDGYLDQFGGKYGRKFMKSQFIKMLEGIHQMPMEKQKSIMAEQLSIWRGSEFPQVDDILVLGFRF